MWWPVPSRRVPVISHSVQAVPPSIERRGTAARRSGDKGKDLLPVPAHLLSALKAPGWMQRRLVHVVLGEARDQCVVVVRGAQQLVDHCLGFVHIHLLTFPTGPYFVLVD